MLHHSVFGHSFWWLNWIPRVLRTCASHLKMIHQMSWRNQLTVAYKQIRIVIQLLMSGGKTILYNDSIFLQKKWTNFPVFIRLKCELAWRWSSVPFFFLTTKLIIVLSPDFRKMSWENTRLASANFWAKRGRQASCDLNFRRKDEFSPTSFQMLPSLVMSFC